MSLARSSICGPVWFTLITLFAAFVFDPSGARAELVIQDLKCEYRVNPLGIDVREPRLSWTLTSDERGQYQTAYRILAASSPDRLAEDKADLWDSGTVQSSNSLNIVYAGKPLVSSQRIYWQVRVRDRFGKLSPYSQPAWWEMSLLGSNDWQGVWLNRPKSADASTTLAGGEPGPLFRREFTVTQAVVSARAYVSGLGYYELHLNGKRVGDQMLDPGWTTYAKRVLYSTYDVTAEIKAGQNAVGIMAGNGWFNPLPLKMWGRINLRDHLTVGTPQVRLQLAIRFADGTSETVVTDTNWKVTDGPVMRNSVYLGETYDARRETMGWDQPGFDDSTWQPAGVPSQAVGPSAAQSAPPIRITRHFKPVKVTEPKKDVYIFDLGQNFAGWARLRAHGSAGETVQLRYGELLYPDGTLNGMTSVTGQIKNGSAADQNGLPSTAFQVDKFILQGKGEETFTPHFTFHGFRYVEVTGLSYEPGCDDMEGLGLNSDVAPAGSFECSNDLFNRIQQMVTRTELSNLFGVESDCPHREKFGYGGDMVAVGEAAILNFDMGQLYAKSVQDLADAVRPNGGFSETSPYVGISDESLGGEAGPIGWGTAQPQLQWWLYQYYGDRRLLEEQYPATKKWIMFLQTCASNNILDNGISDHESLAAKPRALTGTAFYFLNLKLIASIARALGRDADASNAETLAAAVKQSFNGKFLHAENGQYDFGSQACQAFPLYLGLVPGDQAIPVMNVLTQDIVGKNNGHLTTGIFGTKYMLAALSDHGRADVAYGIVNQKTFPGWGFMLENGATTLWEHWAFSDNTFSHNHPMFGSVSEWFYKTLGGIQCAPDAVGFDKVIIRPQIVGDLKWVQSSYNSIHGKVVSNWNRSGTKLQMNVTIPVGATAAIFIPNNSGQNISENGKLVGTDAEIKILSETNNAVAVSVGSGTYHFESDWK